MDLTSELSAALVKYSIILSLTVCILSCQNDVPSNDKTPSTKESNKQLIEKNSLVSAQNKNQPTPYNSRVLSIDKVLVNGQKLLMTKTEFNQTYNQIDSLDSEAAECGSPFDWLDREWMIKTHGAYSDQFGKYENFDGHISVFYSNNAKFDSNNHLFLLNTANADNNTFEIPSKNIVLTNKTTLAEFERLFPKADKEILSNSNEVRFRLMTQKVYDHSLLFYFKNDTFQYVWLWWLLC